MNIPGTRSKEQRAHDELLKRVLRQLASAEKHAESVNKLKDRAQLVYLGQTDPEHDKERNPRDKKDWRSRLFPKVAKEHAQLKVAELCDSAPEWDAKPRIPTPENMELAKAWERAIGAYLDLDDFDQTFRTGMRRCVKYGDQPVKVIMTKDYADEFPRPTIIPLDYRDWFPQPTARSCKTASWAFHRWRDTLAGLESAVDDDGEPLYHNLDQLAPEPGGDSNDQRRRNETQEQFEARQTGLHTLHERWTPWGVLTVANKKVIIRHDEDRDDPIFEDMQIPFEVIRIVEDDDNLGGASESTMLGLEADQEAYWKHLNELNNAITLATRPPKLVDEELDPNAAVYAGLYPDQVMPARGGEQTVKLIKDVAGLGAYGMQELIAMDRDHMERASGMNSTVAGLSSANSATESASNLTQAKSRTRLEIQQSDSDWGRVIRLFASRIRQYCAPEEVLAFTGGVPIQDVPFRGRFVSKLSSERALKELRQNQLTTFWNAIQPQIMPGTIEFKRAKSLLDQMADTYDVGDLGVESKSTAESVQEQQQQQLQLERAQHDMQMEGMVQEAQMQQQIAAEAAANAVPEPGAPPEPETPVHESFSLQYKDAPPSVRKQIEAAAGLKPATAAESAALLAAMKPKPTTQPGGKSGGKGS